MADEKNAAAEQAPKNRRKLTGIVRSNKMDKTVVVEVSRRYVHRKYKKYVKARERYKAHDGDNQYNIGDTVEIMESRPLSKDKRWTVTRLITAAK
ncbi:MAG TPA: 30S ribosomal protein S17 [Polyangiaceae bacterium]|nr:30S ribosomal protein S17 [Polyangiaceae bacterium]